MLGVGVLHASPLIFKTLFSVLHKRNLDKDIKLYIDSSIQRGIEIGIGVKTLANIKKSNYGYLKNTEIEYRECISINFARSIQDSEYKIKFRNTVILNSFHLTLVCSILVLFLIHWLFTFLAKLIWKSNEIGVNSM